MTRARDWTEPRKRLRTSKRIPVSLAFDLEDFDALKRICDEEKRSMQEVAREAIKRFLVGRSCS